MTKDPQEPNKPAQSASSHSPTADVSAETNERRAVSRLIANLTHELKTPLHSMLALASVLASEADGPLNAEQKKQVQKISTNGEQLLEMIVDLLNFSSIDAGTRRVAIESMLVGDYLNSILDSIEPHATQSGVKLNRDISIAKKAFYSDPNLIRHIVQNLVSNAIKFSPKGGEVFVFAELHNDALEVRIADTGIGMPQEVQEAIFKEFYQADAGDTRQFGGVGLGLALVKSSLDLLGGKIEVKSEREKGSLFSLTIPNAESRVPKREVAVLSSEPAIQLSLEAALKTEHYIVSTLSAPKPGAPNPDDALQAIAKATPELVILDIRDDPTQELALVKSIRESTWGQRLPVVILSPSTDLDLRAQSFENGADEFIVKPFDVSELRARIRALFLRGR